MYVSDKSCALEVKIWSINLYLYNLLLPAKNAENRSTGARLSLPMEKVSMERPAKPTKAA
jgi:hypothetical protein